MDAPTKTVVMEPVVAKNAEMRPVDQPARVEPMTMDNVNLRGGDDDGVDGGDICCGLCAAFACFECCKCCC